MKLYISALDHAWKLNFSNYVHLSSMKKNVSISYVLVILCNVREVYISELGCYISALGHVRVLILSSSSSMYKQN